MHVQTAALVAATSLLERAAAGQARPDDLDQAQRLLHQCRSAMQDIAHLPRGRDLVDADSMLVYLPLQVKPASAWSPSAQVSCYAARGNVAQLNKTKLLGRPVVQEFKLAAIRQDEAALQAALARCKGFPGFDAGLLAVAADLAAELGGKAGLPVALEALQLSLHEQAASLTSDGLEMLAQARPIQIAGCTAPQLSTGRK